MLYLVLYIILQLQSCICERRLSPPNIVNLSKTKKPNLFDNGKQLSIKKALRDTPETLDFSLREKIHIYLDFQTPTYLTKFSMKLEKNCGQLKSAKLSFSPKINGPYSRPITLDCSIQKIGNYGEIEENLEITAQFIKLELIAENAVSEETIAKSIAFFTKSDFRRVLTIPEVKNTFQNGKQRIKSLVFKSPLKLQGIVFKLNTKATKKHENFKIIKENDEQILMTAFRVNTFEYRWYFGNEIDMKGIVLHSGSIFDAKIELYEKAPTRKIGEIQNIDPKKSIVLENSTSIRQIELLKMDQNGKTENLPKSTVWYEFLLRYERNDETSQYKELLYLQYSGILNAYFKMKKLQIFTPSVTEQLRVQLYGIAAKTCVVKSENAVAAKSYFIEGEEIDYWCTKGESKRMKCEAGGIKDSHSGQVVEAEDFCK